LKIDDRQLKELIVESEDLQVDALRDVKKIQPVMADLRASRRGQPVDLERIRAFNAGRRRLLRNGGMGIGALSARGLLGGAFGTTLMGIIARPAHAQADLDTQILQTAASLENLAVTAYEAALALPFFDQNATVVAFAQTTMNQHAEHGEAFNALAETPQELPHPPGFEIVESAMPLEDYMDVVALAATLEQVATETYVANVSMLQDTEAKTLMASIMGVEAQHLATLRAVGALLAGGAPQLITVSDTDGAVDVAALPAAAGSVAFAVPEGGAISGNEPQDSAFIGDSLVQAPDTGDVE
jgi:rubrerythrin